MSGLPEFFEATSDGLYDRHHYKIILSSGKSVEIEDWQTVRETWFNTPNKFLSHVEVLDIKQTKGFG